MRQPKKRGKPKMIFKHGDMLGSLMFIKEVEPHIKPDGQKARMALVKCECGNQFVCDLHSARYGGSNHCKVCRYKISANKNTIHGLSQDKLFSVWNDMNRRCHDAKVKSYERYGAKGISVYLEWRHDFQSFYDYVTKLENYHPDNIGMGGYTLDRIDNDGNYEPSNIRWADATTQNFNKGLQKNNTTGYRGISIRKYGTFQVKVGYKKKKHYVGTFKTLDEAICARNAFVKENNIPLTYKNC